MSKLSEKQIIVLSIKCIDLVSRLHDKGILHCDIKLENIMLDNSKEFMEKDSLTDEDIEQVDLHFIDASYTQELPPNANSIAGTYSFGTPACMAPEITKKTGISVFIYSKESDLYALGFLLKMLFSNRPTHPAIIDQLMNTKPAERPSLQTLREKFCDELLALKGSPSPK